MFNLTPMKMNQNQSSIAVCFRQGREIKFKSIQLYKAEHLALLQYFWRGCH